MRVVAVLSVVLALVASHGMAQGKPSLSLSKFCMDGYKTFIQKLRKDLTADNNIQLYGIPILKHSVSNSERFLLIDLVNEKYEVITLAIDIVNLGAVAYRAGNKCFFFSNAPKDTYQLIFPTTNQSTLSFDNTFQSIENAAGTLRSKTSLGLEPLESAISNLFQYQQDRVPEALLVILQMVIEASKFKFIEQSVTNSIRDDGESFAPSLAMVSLEDNWSQLSAQIQASKSVQGVFGSVIKLYNSKEEAIEVDSIYNPIVIANIALQLYHCNINNNVDNFIRMPGVVGVESEDDDDDVCNTQTSRATRISGRDGRCVDVANGYDYDSDNIILYSCGRQANQKWTFERDGTIRSLGKCLMTNTSSFGMFAVIYDCDKAKKDDVTWEVSSTGTIRNPSSNLVLSASIPKSRADLTVEANTYAASQGWRVGDYVNPILTSIIGLYEMCLEATSENKNIWLESCVKNKSEQIWALYSDQTIRVNNNRSLCVTSPIDDSSEDDALTLITCNASPNQRWVFMSDGTILNPQTSHRMDVDLSRKKIILYVENNSRNQQWIAYY